MRYTIKKGENDKVWNSLLEKIEEPDFYKEISDVEEITIIQGGARSLLNEKPHYDRKEQVMCALDGRVKMLLIPHVFRQEVYAGMDVQDSPYYDGNEQVEAD